MEEVSALCLTIREHRSDAIAMQAGEVSDKSADDIETELEAKRAQLEMNMHTNAGVVEQYRKRQQEVRGYAAELWVQLE